MKKKNKASRIKLNEAFLMESAKSVAIQCIKNDGDELIETIRDHDATACTIKLCNMMASCFMSGALGVYIMEQHGADFSQLKTSTAYKEATARYAGQIKKMIEDQSSS